jgi:hypothetical protein
VVPGLFRATPYQRITAGILVREETDGLIIQLVVRKLFKQGYKQNSVLLDIYLAISKHVTSLKHVDE